MDPISGTIRIFELAKNLVTTLRTTKLICILYKFRNMILLILYIHGFYIGRFAIYLIWFSKIIEDSSYHSNWSRRILWSTFSAPYGVPQYLASVPQLGSHQTSILTISHIVDKMSFFQRLNNVIVHHLNSLIGALWVYPSFEALYKKEGGKGYSYLDFYRRGLVLEQTAFGLDYVRPLPSSKTKLTTCDRFPKIYLFTVLD